MVKCPEFDHMKELFLLVTVKAAIRNEFLRIFFASNISTHITTLR